MLAAGLLAISAVPDSPDDAQMASLAALMRGAFLIVTGVLHLGFVADLCHR